MATRFYFPFTGAAAVSPEYSASWEYSGEALRRAAVKTKISSTNTQTFCYNNQNNTKDCLMHQYVTGQLEAYDFTTADTIKLQVQCSKTVDTTTMNLYVVIRVVSADGGTFRGTLYDGASPTAVVNQSSGVNYNTSIAGGDGGHVHPSGSVSMQAGDRLVIEIGARSVSAACWTQHYFLFGDDNAADLPETETDTTVKNPWMEFSATIADYSAGGTNILQMLI